MSKTVLIADSNVGYLERIKKFFVPRYSSEFSVICCASREQMQEALSNGEIHLVVSCGEFLSSARRQLIGKAVLVLVEKQEETLREGKSLFKYQRREALFQQIKNALEKPEEYILYKEVQRTRFILFQSASGGKGCSTMAAACAKAKAVAGKTVLYLNLEAAGTAGFYFRGEGTGDILQFLDMFRKGIDVNLALERNKRRDMSGVIFLESGKSAVENAVLDHSLLLRAVAELCESSMLDYVIVDKAAATVDEHMAWLEKADRIIFVENGSDVGNLKFARMFLGMISRPELNRGELEMKCRILYNMTSVGNFRELSHFNLPVLGKFEYTANNTKVQLEQMILRSGIFTRQEDI